MLYYNRLDNECTKLGVSRAVLPHVPHILCMPTCSHVFVPLPFTYLPFCVPYVTSFYVPYVPTFFYVLCVPSLFTCLTCLRFFYVLEVSSFFLRAWRVFIFVRAWRVFIFYVLDVPSFFFTYFTCLHFFSALRASIFYVLYVPSYWSLQNWSFRSCYKSQNKCHHLTAGCVYLEK